MLPPPLVCLPHENPQGPLHQTKTQPRFEQTQQPILNSVGIDSLATTCHSHHRFSFALTSSLLNMVQFVFHNTHQQDPKLFPSFSLHYDPMSSMIKTALFPSFLPHQDPLICSSMVEREATTMMVAPHGEEEGRLCELQA